MQLGSGCRSTEEVGETEPYLRGRVDKILNLGDKRRGHEKQLDDLMTKRLRER